MKADDYIQLVQDRQRFWGVNGPWRGEVANFEFTTKAGLKAAVRRDAVDGHLYGCVAIQNPEHPALKHPWNLGPAKVGAFDRPINRIPEVLPQILDLPGISQGAWFVFSCGYETFGDLIPRWAHRSSMTYRDAAYVQARCEELASLFGDIWNQHLATRPSIRGTHLHDVKLHDVVERELVARDMEKRIAGIKQPAPAYKHPEPDLSWLDTLGKGLFTPPDRPAIPYSARFGQANTLPPAPKKSVPAPPFIVKNMKALGTLKHEISAVDDNTVHIKVIGRNGKILVEFDISGKKGA